jgi:hypothetical protein
MNVEPGGIQEPTQVNARNLIAAFPSEALANVDQELPQCIIAVNAHPWGRLTEPHPKY